MKALRRNWGTQPYETYSKKKKKELKEDLDSSTTVGDSNTLLLIMDK